MEYGSPKELYMGDVGVDAMQFWIIIKPISFRT
jgi:hypothetical protein